jgi:uncharacterized protein YukE
MTDDVTYTEGDRTYRVRGLQAKARSIFEASHELDEMIADRLSAGRKALEHWRGPHAVTYANELNGVLAKMATLKVTLWQAQTTLERFPEAGSWNAGRYGEEIAAGARVDAPIEPGTVSAETDQLRRYATTAAGQDERFYTLANTVDLDGVSAEVTREVRSGTAVETQPVDVRTLITLPTPRDQVPALMSASSELTIFTRTVATAIDHADHGTLALLARYPAAKWAEFLRREIALLRQDPAGRWAALPQSMRQTLIGAAPEQIGSMNGLPTLVRDQANRIVLQRTREQLRARRDDLRNALRRLPPRTVNPMPWPWLGTDHGRLQGERVRIEAELARINERLDGIEAIERRLRPKPGRPPAYLLGINGDGSGRAIVAIGNPDTADNVATLVPGADNALSGGSIRQSMKRAGAMVTDAERLAPGTDTSSIVWLGYESPEQSDARNPSYARAGAAELRRFQEGLANINGHANHTVIGHSYGATVVGHAARTPGLHADNLVFVGSLGVGVDRASDLNISTDRVFATSAPSDVVDGIVGAGAHDRDPTDPAFGSRVFPSDDGPSSLPWDAHSDYWKAGNRARDSMAGIITGRYGNVEKMPPPEYRPPPRP